MLNNEDATIREAIDLALARDADDSATHNPDSPTLGLGDFPDDYSSPTEEDDPIIILRWCVVCHSTGNKARMAKCRKCHEWSHTLCKDGTRCTGRSDPNFSFWLCKDCRSNLPGSYKFTYWSKADIKTHSHFQDSDNEVLA
ncbi:hypothetical protein FCM35_KLT10350 [Carex littledalei]|uniref:PHD-type domain-containing protein n=1 Tax=Carex littledalei TaxID=544730 RepID=A0A833QTZ7_9POAL|nr:hypothetical protein FCM35_KLT10350 [Carex littledalei]